MSASHNVHSCKACGCAGHQTARSQYCLVRKVNTFEVGSLVALSLPKFKENKAERLRNTLWPGFREASFPLTTLKRTEKFYSMENRCGYKVPFYFSHEPIEGSKEKRRANVNAARILSFTDNKYIVRVSVRTPKMERYGHRSFQIYGSYEESVIVLKVPVFFEGQRLLFPLKSRKWELPKSMVAECRAYYNRGHAKIRGKAKVPTFLSTSWRKGETAKDKEVAWRLSKEYKKECRQEKKLIKKMCLLPDELFREVMEFAYPKPGVVAGV